MTAAQQSSEPVPVVLPCKPIKLEIPAAVDYVSVARLVVGAVASSDSRLSESRREDLKIAVSEACTNAVHAAPDDGEQHRVVVSLEFTPDSFVVDVADEGGGFDPSAASDTPLLDEQKMTDEGGFGIPLMRVLSDQTEFKTRNTGTTVRLVFYRPALEVD